MEGGGCPSPPAHLQVSQGLRAQLVLIILRAGAAIIIHHVPAHAVGRWMRGWAGGTKVDSPQREAHAGAARLGFRVRRPPAIPLASPAKADNNDQTAPAESDPFTPTTSTFHLAHT